MSLHDPAGEVLEIQEATHIDLSLSLIVIVISLSILDLVEDVFELGHALDLFVEEGTHEILLSNLQLVCLGDFVDISLRLMHLDEVF